MSRRVPAGRTTVTDAALGAIYQNSRTEVIKVVLLSRAAAGSLGRLAVGATQMYMSNVRIIVNLCMSNLFDRFPKLHIVSAESGIGWVPFILEAMEYQLDQMVTEPDEVNLTINGNHAIYQTILKEEDKPKQEKLVHNLSDLALLSQGLLKGNNLTDFIQRSVELMGGETKAKIILEV